MKRVKDYLRDLMELKKIEFSWVLMQKHQNRDLGEDERNLKQMTHEMPFKSSSGNFRGNFAGKVPAKFHW